MNLLRRKSNIFNHSEIDYRIKLLTLCIPTTYICVKNTVLASMNSFLFNLSYNVMIMAAVTSGLQTIVKTGITIVSYFGNMTASLFALTIVRKFTPR